MTNIKLRALVLLTGCFGVSSAACSGEDAGPSSGGAVPIVMGAAPAPIMRVPDAPGTAAEGPGGEVEVIRSALTSGPTKINAGGPATSPFVADVDYSGGTTVTRNNTIILSGVINPAPAAVYQSQRYGNMTYTLPGFTAKKNYTVRLHFCETHWSSAGKRSFNVNINGYQVLTNFDTFVEAGGMNRAVVKPFTIPANASGQIVVKFTTIKDQAFISGIEAAAAGSLATNSPEISTACVRPVHVTTTTATAANPSMAKATVVPVLWNGSVPLPTSTIQTFGTIVESSSWLHWVQAQYGVGAVNMDTAPIPITPSAPNSGSTLTAAQIGGELANQIAANKKLPPMTADLSGADSFLYMVYFPSGTKLTLTDDTGKTTSSCTDFCGYHQFFTGNGHNVVFAALPDLSTCGPGANGQTCQGSDFVSAATMTASHELVESLTDPLVSTGWRDRSQSDACGGEIADLCNGRPVGLTGSSGQSVTVQQMFSNTTNSCELLTPGGPDNQTGFGDDVSAFALAGDLTDTSGLQVAQGGVPINGQMSITLATLPVNNPTFLTTWQQQGWPVFGDFDGDGLADMGLVQMPSGSTIPLAWSGTFPLNVTNAGISTTKPPFGLTPDGSSFPALAAMTAAPPVVGDFNGDGRADVASIIGGSTIPIAYGAGTATGTPGQFWSTNKSDGGLNAAMDTIYNQMHFLAADFNRDGRSDLAVLGGQSSAFDVIIAISNGDGTFATAQKKSVFTDKTEKTVSSFGSIVSTNYNYLQTLAGDYDGDGLMDIALVGAKPTLGTIPIALGQPDGSFVLSNSAGGDNASIASTVADLKSFFKIVTGDYDGDGRWDLAIFGSVSASAPVLALSNGDGTFKIITTNGFSGTSFMSLANEVGVYVTSAQMDSFVQSN